MIYSAPAASCNTEVQGSAMVVEPHERGGFPMAYAIEMNEVERP